jgi:spermidine synthase
MRKFLPVLAFLSGVCGIAYEVLYSRLLSLYFGEMFYIVGAILATFLFGISVGSLQSSKWYKGLWKIELTIGIYALLLNILTTYGKGFIIKAFLPPAANSPAVLVFIVFFILVIPSTLIGFSVPLFTFYCQHNLKADKIIKFNLVYKWYNLGAGLCVLGMEFFLLRTIGLSKSIYVAAGINLLIAFMLRTISAPESLNGFSSDLKIRFHGLRSKKQSLIIFLLGILSGIIQLLYLNLSETIWGPFHENFSLLLAFGLISLTIGTMLVSKFRPSFREYILYGAFLLILSIAFVPALAYGFAFFSPYFVNYARIGLKVVTLFSMTVIPFAFFGGILPAYFQNSDKFNAEDISYNLAFSSIGNCVGYLMSILFLFELLSNRAIVTLVAVSIVVCTGILNRKSTVRFIHLGILVSFLLMLYSFSTKIFYLSFDDFVSLSRLKGALNALVDYQTYKKFNTRLTLANDKNGNLSYTINGYKSLVIRKGEANFHEMLFGIIPNMYIPNRNNALVLGAGTGITAGAVSQFYKSTDVVEISPAVLNTLDKFARQNFNLSQDAHTHVILDDALMYLYRTDKKYDLILSTVTSPIFFSSSKLYSYDFYNIVKKRLKDKGRFVFWFDSRVSLTGQRILLETVKRSFKYCHIAFIKLGYQQVICSDAPLKPELFTKQSMPPKIVKALGFEPDAFFEILRYIVFDTHQIFNRKWYDEINTFDKQILEYAISLRSSGLRSWSNQQLDTYHMEEIDFCKSPFLDRELTSGELGKRFYCLFLLVPDIRPLDFYLWVEKMAAANGGRVPASFFSEVPFSIDSSSYLPYTGLALQTGHIELAHQLAAAYKGDKSSFLFHLIDAAYQLETQNDVSDELLAMMYKQHPLDAQLRYTLAQVSFNRGLFREAYLHIQFLQNIKKLDKKEKELEKKIRQRYSPGRLS